VIREIITDKLLLSMPSDPVSDDEDIHPLMHDMLDTAKHWAGTKIGCLGLAANQIGWLRQIITIWDGSQWVVMVNPEWEPRAGKQGLSHEMCLSRPGVSVKVRRHKRIYCRWWTPSGESVDRKFSNTTARVIQHECDHLNGIFINN